MLKVGGMKSSWGRLVLRDGEGARGMECIEDRWRRSGTKYRSEMRMDGEAVEGKCSSRVWCWGMAMNGSGGGRVVESGVARWRGIEIVGGRAVERDGGHWIAVESGTKWCWEMMMHGWRGGGGKVVECGTEIWGGEVSGGECCWESYGRNREAVNNTEEHWRAVESVVQRAMDTKERLRITLKSIGERWRAQAAVENCREEMVHSNGKKW
jgi:hypothetical protein